MSDIGVKDFLKEFSPELLVVANGFSKVLSIYEVSTGSQLSKDEMKPITEKIAEIVLLLKAKKETSRD